MHNEFTSSHRSHRRYAVFGAVTIAALLGLLPGDANADQHPVPAGASRAVEVPLTDLNLATADGMQAARGRLRAMAASVCAEPAKSLGLPRQPNFEACVDSTVAAHLRVIDALKRNKMQVSNSVTRAASVSLADLDLSTLEGAHIARQRLEAMARRLCGEIARRPEQVVQPSYVDCVHDTVAGALAQADAIAADRDVRTARRNAPR